MRAVDEAVDDPEPNPKRLKRGGQHQSGWASSHHQNVHRCSFVHLSTAADAIRVTILRAWTAE
jgi:hypothetical protein